MRTLKDGEEPEPKKQSFKAWKDKDKAKAKTGPKVKKARTPAKKAEILTDDEVKRLNELNHRTKDKAEARANQEAAVRKQLDLPQDAPIPKTWVTGGTKFDLDAMGRFCQVYSGSSLMTKAAKAAGVSVSTVRNYIKTNPMFQEMFEDAKMVYRDRIVETVVQRAVDGIEEPIIGGMARDQVVAYKRVYSDRLLELEAKRVEHGYRDKGGVEINTGGGVLVVQAGNMDEGDWEKKYGSMEAQPD